MTWKKEPSYFCDDQGDSYDDYSFADATHMSWHEDFHFTEAIETRMDAQCQESEETNIKIENYMKLGFSILNIRPQKQAQGDYEIPNREEDEQVFDVDEQIAQNSSPIVQENSPCDNEITLPSDTDDARKKGKGQSQVITPRSNEQVENETHAQPIIC
ncbi:hypothetical protein V6N11_036923 [Hibiscus sabdariffa]|uniref:Uncharacterized protein n=1 Tax=Hibiscus sabdariffa TaxID=183260 RepID=A0ABR2RBS9_9ROSI